MRNEATATRPHDRDPYAAALRLVEGSPALATARAIEQATADGSALADHERKRRREGARRETPDPAALVVATLALGILAAPIADALASTGTADPAALVAYGLATLALGVAATPDREGVRRA